MEPVECYCSIDIVSWPFSGYLLGVLACSATYISPNFRMNEIFSALTESIRDNLCNTDLKVTLLSALGEFMFYAATQEEGENKRIANWDPPGMIFLSLPINMFLIELLLPSVCPLKLEVMAFLILCTQVFSVDISKA